MNHPAEASASDLAALSPWAVQLAQTFVALAGDVALLVDARGVITHLVLGTGVMLASVHPAWAGRPWTDTVTVETRPKIEQMLADLQGSGRTRPRQVNHPAGASTPDVPVIYSAVRLGPGGPVLALGRELGEVAQMQRRFVELQQEVERGYWRAQRASAHHHALLLHAANDAVLQVDAASIVRAANRAAGALFGRPAVVLAGQSAPLLFQPDSREALRLALADADGSDTWVRVSGQEGRSRVAVAPLPAGARLLRVRGIDTDPARRHRAYTQLVDRGAEAVFVADREGRLLAANPALLFLLGAVSEAELIGRPVADWVQTDDAAGLVASVLRTGAEPRAEARLHALSGPVVEVEWSAAVLVEGGEPFIGGTLRRVAAPGAAERLAVPELHAALDRLALGIGRRRLPELLDEARHVVEAHLIRAALERAGGDMDRAAELLGIRRTDLARRARRAGLPGSMQ